MELGDWPEEFKAAWAAVLDLQKEVDEKNAEHSPVSICSSATPEQIISYWHRMALASDVIEAALGRVRSWPGTFINTNHLRAAVVRVMGERVALHIHRSGYMGVGNHDEHMIACPLEEKPPLHHKPIIWWKDGRRVWGCPTFAESAVRWLYKTADLSVWVGIDLPTGEVVVID